MVKVFNSMSYFNNMPFGLVAKRDSLQIFILIIFPSQKLVKELIINNICEQSISECNESILEFGFVKADNVLQLTNKKFKNSG